MFKNYLKTAYRSLIKQKNYALINIVGLSISLAVTLLMLLWVQDEWSTDKFHVNDERIYKLKRTIPLEGEKFDVYSGTPYPLLVDAPKKIPGIEKYIPLGYTYEESLQKDEQVIRAKGAYGTVSYFETFSYPIISGDIKQFDEKINAIVISKSLAKRFFGNIWESAAIGSTIHIHDKGDFSVEAIFSDFPENASIKNDFIYNIKHFIKDNDWVMKWGNSGMGGAFLLSENANAKDLENKLTELFHGQQEGDFKEGCILQKYSDAYLYGKFDEQLNPAGGRIEYVRTFGIAALLLLIISCINFVNLATARASKRAKEVGVRKAIGAAKKALVGQFMVEAAMITIISVGLALLLAEMVLPNVRLLTEKTLAFNYAQPMFWGGIFSVIVLTTLFSGAYPAFVLSSFRPVNVLKGKFREAQKNISFRKILVVSQFVLALLLIVSALVVQQQVEYIKNKNLGINKDNLIVISKDDKIQEKYEVLKTELLNQEGVAKVTVAGPTPIEMDASTSGVTWPGKRAEQANIEFQILWAESNFTDVFNVPLAAGRYYRAGAIQDTTSIVFNEKAIEIMELENPIGQTINWWGKPRQIIGVLKNFHNRSLHDDIEPMGVLLDPEGAWSMFVKMEAGKTTEAISGINSAFEKVIPEVPLHFEFVDEQYQSSYDNEILTGKLAKYFAFISIFISCLGLLGLATFMAEQKTKEIGIRKVLGATIPNLIGLLSKEFLLLVGTGTIIGLPISIFLLNGWLENFAFKINIQWWMFAIPIVAAILVAAITVGVQAFRAALTNPVESLRSE